MNLEKEIELMKREDGLSRTLNMEFISTPEPDTCKARMKVDKLNRQVFGFLSGGATLALAENLAGVGSMALCRGKICVGINVSGSHVRAVLEGDTVTATARLQYKGRTLHQWHIDICNNKGQLVSTVEVTNYVLTPGKTAGAELNEEVR
ncbi:MAG: PaaI family thioesterase [Prevotella sp.]|nr:PaaI family thioesterase [Prevotella sp.]